MRTSFTRSVRAVPAVVAVLVAVALTGCSDAPDPPAPDAGASAPGAPPAPSTPPGDPATVVPSPSTTPSPGAAGVPVPVPVQRPDALPEAQRLPAPVVPFDGRAVYEDGVSLAVRDVAQGTTTGTGAGAQPGRPVTSLVLELRNGSAVPVDLTGVVVSARSGAQGAPAAPVYGEGQEDFTGTAGPGATRTATYSFSIPTAALDDVAVTVDFDGRHAPALWRGSLR